MEEFKEPEEQILHAPGCKCTYCDKKSQDLFQKLLKGCPEIISGDGLGQTTPEVYKFAEQSKDEVMDLFKKAEKQAADFRRTFAQKCKDPILTEGECPTWAEDVPDLHSIRGSYRNSLYMNCPALDDDPANILAKLAGVFDESKQKEVDNEVLYRILESVQNELSRKFPGLSIEWSDDVNRCLVVSGAKTRIKYTPIKAAYEGLTEITSPNNAARIVARVIVKKFEVLFI